MAGKRFSVTKDAIALVAATAKTVLAVKAPSTVNLQICKWYVEFDGTTSTNNMVEVDLYKSTTGTSTGTSLTIVPLDLGNPTSSSASAHHTVTSGLTLGNPFETHRIHPTTGFVQEQSLGQEYTLDTSGLFVIVCTAPQAVNVTVGCTWYE